MALTAYGVPLSQVTSFKYLGRVLEIEDNKWPEVLRATLGVSDIIGAAESDIEQVGSGYPNIGKYLLGGCAIGPSIGVRYTGLDTTHEEGIGSIPP